MNSGKFGNVGDRTELAVCTSQWYEVPVHGRNYPKRNGEVELGIVGKLRRRRLSWTRCRRGFFGRRQYNANVINDGEQVRRDKIRESDRSDSEPTEHGGVNRHVSYVPRSTVLPNDGKTIVNSSTSDR